MEDQESINKKIINLMRILHLYLHELERIQGNKSTKEQVSMSDKIELVLKDPNGIIKARLKN